MGSLPQTIRDAVRKMAYSTSIDNLKKKGVDKVSVVGMDRIVNLIQESVKRSLRHKMLATDERAEVASATKDEFLRLLKNNEDLARSSDELRRSKDDAEAQVDQLRRELASQEAMLDKKLRSSSNKALSYFEGEDIQLAEQVDLLFSDIDQLPADKRTQVLRSRTFDLLMDTVREARKKLAEANRAVHDKEVDNLQRRIKKLNESLESSEHRLRKVASLKTIDEGISSVFRDVQGLNAEDTQFERKSELMAQIFQANLTMQKGAMPA